MFREGETKVTVFVAIFYIMFVIFLEPCPCFIYFQCLRNWFDIFLVAAGLLEVFVLGGDPKNLLMMRLMRTLKLDRHVGLTSCCWGKTLGMVLFVWLVVKNFVLFVVQ